MPSPSSSAPRRAAHALLVVATLASAVPSVAAASGGDDARVRASERCGRGARTRLDLRARDGGIRAEYELEHGRAGERWRVVVVQEGRVAWRGTPRIGGTGELRVRLTLRDLAGADRVEVRASGPRGTSCAVAATLRG